MAFGHPAPRRQAITTVGGNNVALQTDCILAAFQGPEVGSIGIGIISKLLRSRPFVAPTSLG
jgi:hypothetical protein